MSFSEEEDEYVDNIVYLSDNIFRTGASEYPTHKGFLQRIDQAFNFQQNIPIPGELISRGSQGFGNVELINLDQELDGYTDIIWNGRSIEVLIGGKYHPNLYDEYNTLFSEFERIFYGTVDGLQWDNGKISFSVYDFGINLERNIQDEFYQGTGTTEGGSELEGKPKPICMGRCVNVPPVLVDTTYDVYQVHFRSIEEVEGVRDKGDDLTADGDIVDLVLDDVYSWTPVSGHYITDLANGLIRLGAPPDGKVTADIRGDNVGGYIETSGDILKRIAVDLVNIVESIEINSDSFLDFIFNSPEQHETGYFPSALFLSLYSHPPV